jgi:hypothetical protein
MWPQLDPTEITSLGCRAVMAAVRLDPKPPAPEYSHHNIARASWSCCRTTEHPTIQPVWSPFSASWRRVFCWMPVRAWRCCALVPGHRLQSAASHNTACTLLSIVAGCCCCSCQSLSRALRVNSNSSTSSTSNTCSSVQFSFASFRGLVQPSDVQLCDAWCSNTHGACGPCEQPGTTPIVLTRLPTCCRRCW